MNIDLIFPLIFYAGFIGTVLYTLYDDYERELKRQEVRGWARTKAIIRYGRVKTIVEGSGKKETTFYEVEAGYSYQVAGEQYKSASLTPVYETFASRHLANHLKDQLRPGRNIHAYFDPKNPEDSYLAPGPPVITWAYAFGYLLCGILIPTLALFSYLDNVGVEVSYLANWQWLKPGGFAVPILFFAAALGWFLFKQIIEKKTILEEFREPLGLPEERLELRSLEKVRPVEKVIRRS